MKEAKEGRKQVSQGRGRRKQVNKASRGRKEGRKEGRRVGRKGGRKEAREKKRNE